MWKWINPANLIVWKWVQLMDESEKQSKFREEMDKASYRSYCEHPGEVNRVNEETGVLRLIGRREFPLLL